MGNCPAIRHPKRPRAPQAAKPDGEVLTSGAPVSVTALSSRFKNSRVGACGDSSRHPSEDSRRQNGKVCDMVAAGRVCSVSATAMAETELGGVNRNGTRVKLFITKKKLQELLSDSVSVEQVLAAIGNHESEQVADSGRSWKPQLETIPEYKMLSN